MVLSHEHSPVRSPTHVATMKPNQTTALGDAWAVTTVTLEKVLWSPKTGVRITLAHTMDTVWGIKTEAAYSAAAIKTLRTFG